VALERNDQESGDARRAADALREAFARLARGEMDALGVAWEICAADAYGLALWRLRSHADAADVVSDLFVRLARMRADLAAVREPRAFVLTLVRRIAVDHVRRRQVRRAEELTDALLVEADSPGAERSFDAARASRMLASLPENQREAVFLHHFAGCTFAEIAAITRVPTFTAASRYRLGIARLRKLMGVTQR
jgi:RNA polymerase sigma-70 factor (ECF subfamily)